MLMRYIHIAHTPLGIRDNGSLSSSPGKSPRLEIARHQLKNSKSPALHISAPPDRLLQLQPKHVYVALHSVRTGTEVDKGSQKWQSDTMHRRTLQSGDPSLAAGIF